MARSAAKKCRGFVLSRKPYRETSLLLEVFTEEFGRVGLVARGIRGKRKTSGNAQIAPFNELEIAFTVSGDLGSLVTAEPASAPFEIAGSALFMGWYINELILRSCTRYDEHAELYLSYRETLLALSKSSDEKVLRLFERDLLSELGFGLPLEQEVNAETSYIFDQRQGFISEGAPGQARFSGADIISLRESRLDTPESLKAAKRLLSRALPALIGSAPLKSRELYKEMNNLNASPPKSIRTPQPE